MTNRKAIIFFIVALLIFTSCNVTKLVPKGDALYTGATVKVEDSTISKKEKKKVEDASSNLPQPKPNSRFFGIPFKLILYNMAGDTSKHSFIRKFLRKTGNPPVLLSSVNLDYNVKLLDNYLQNLGYFKTVASADTIVKKKKGHAYYTVTPGPVYTIRNVKFETDSSSSVGQAIQATKPESFLKPGNSFNLAIIKAERERIDGILKQRGYYFFSPDALIIEVDSTVGTNQVDMFLKVKEDAPDIAEKPYIIDSVYIFTDYRLNGNGADTSIKKKALYGGYYIVDPRNKFKPKLFPQIMLFDSGDVYNRDDHNITLSRLINLNVFKFVKNRFDITNSNDADTGRLNTYYYLTPQEKKSLRAELSGNTKSNDYVGSQLTLSFKNRNTFKGAEELAVHTNAGTEVQYGGSKSGYNTYDVGGGVSLTIPKFVVPFFHFNTTNAFVPKTKIDLSYDLLNRRKLYTLSSLKGELGYEWKPSYDVSETFNLFSVNYVHSINVTKEYIDSIANNPILKHSIDTQFIIGSNYSITVNPFVSKDQGTGFYIEGLADASGNLSGLLIPKDPASGQKKLFGASISQYLKAQTDLRYYLQFSSKARLANRLLLGFGYPYGNSQATSLYQTIFHWR